MAAAGFLTAAFIAFMALARGCDFVGFVAFMGFFMDDFMPFVDSPPPAPPKPRPLPISAMPDARSLAASRSADASRAMTSARRMVRRVMSPARAMAIVWLCWSKTMRNVSIARWILCCYAPRLLCFLLAQELSLLCCPISTRELFVFYCFCHWYHSMSFHFISFPVNFIIYPRGRTVRMHHRGGQLGNE